MGTRPKAWSQRTPQPWRVTTKALLRLSQMFVEFHSCALHSLPNRSSSAVSQSSLLGYCLGDNVCVCFVAVIMAPSAAFACVCSPDTDERGADSYYVLVYLGLEPQPRTQEPHEPVFPHPVTLPLRSRHDEPFLSSPSRATGHVRPTDSILLSYPRWRPSRRWQATSAPRPSASLSRTMRRTTASGAAAFLFQSTTGVPVCLSAGSSTRTARPNAYVLAGRYWHNLRSCSCSFSTSSPSCCCYGNCHAHANSCALQPSHLQRTNLSHWRLIRWRVCWWLGSW